MIGLDLVTSNDAGVYVRNRYEEAHDTHLHIFLKSSIGCLGQSFSKIEAQSTKAENTATQ